MKITLKRPWKSRKKVKNDSRTISAASGGKKKERKFDRDFLSEMGKLFANNEISNKNADIFDSGNCRSFPVLCSYCVFT